MNANFTTNKILIDYFSFTIRDVEAEDIITMLGLDGVAFIDNYGTKGYHHRYYYDGVDWMNIGDYNYWTSTPDPNNNDMAYHFESYNDVLHYQSSDGRSYGYSVRCFRSPVNEFVVTFEPNN